MEFSVKTYDLATDRCCAFPQFTERVARRAQKPGEDKSETGTTLKITQMCVHSSPIDYERN
jgi:hypothetical protein